MSQSKQLENKKHTVEVSKNLEQLFNCALKMNLPVAMWRLPATNKINLVCQIDEDSYTIENLESAPEGFIFSPFQASENRKQEYIRADISYDSDSDDIALNPSYNKSQESYDKFVNTLTKVSNDANFNYTDYLEPAPNFKSEKHEFVAVVEAAKKSISDGYYQKIVPARRQPFKIKKGFHPVQEMLNLCEAYEGAFVSLVYFPGAGIWMGASPELLISVKDKNEFETISLAGTQSISEGFDLAKASWTQKEIEEQALVSRYIVNCFKRIRLREFDEYGPKTVRAGNLMHLKTSYKVNMETANFPQLGSVMLELLHPTSAVCGMPMKPSVKFLEKNEGFDREYFSGFLGPVNMDGNINIYVNLRCAKIFRNGGVLFAGAGVTEDSDPDSEWKETQLKFQTLLNVIDK